MTALLLTLACFACKPSPPVCHFGVEHAVFEAAALGFDDVALITRPGGTLALFSDATGTYARVLGVHGAPLGAARRLTARCSAGLAAAVSGEDTLLACSRRAGANAETSGQVALYRLNTALDVERLRELGAPGPNSFGVAVAAHGGAIALAFHDQTLVDARIWFTPDAARSAPEQLSDALWDASGPGIAQQGAQLYVYWAETRSHANGHESRVSMRGWQQGKASVILASGKDPWPSPALVASERGLWLAHRDSHVAGRKPGLFLTRLDVRGAPTGAAVRVARADGVGRPTLRSCLGGLLAATPRTYAGDYMIGVVRADGALSAISGEQQFYEDSHEFAQVAASCSGAEALLLIAERGRLGTQRAGLRAVTFACEAG